jgi:multisubunit Na+/H+ antiporter MnhB subunit
MIETAFDILLALAILTVAARALYAADLFTGVVHFIIFGLLTAIAWARLGAPDIALAEAAIGAGLTGALLLDAVRDIGEGRTTSGGLRQGLIGAVPALGLAALLVAAVLALHSEPGGLTLIVWRELAASPTSNAVTAVLLDFRAYDTWLELTVLFAAVAAALAVRRTYAMSDVVPVSGGSRLLRSIVRRLAPLMLLTGGYLLWLGTHAPGGAFQAGAVIAATFVLLFLSGAVLPEAAAGVAFKLLVLGGTIAFLAWAAGSLVAGVPMLTVPAGGGALIVAIEAAAAAAIGVTLASLFLAAQPAATDGSES